MSQLRTIPIRRSLIRPNLIMGCERELLSFSGMLSAMVVLVLMQVIGIFFAALSGFILWSGFLFVLSRLGNQDPIMSKIYLRHIRYRIFYPAHGRFTAPTPTYKSH
jgi:type IV secretion system protein TrbD